MYKEICQEINDISEGKDKLTPYEIAKLCHVQYGEVQSIFNQPIKLREMVLLFMYKKSGKTPAQFMARLDKAVQKAIQEKLESKLKTFKAKKK